MGGSERPNGAISSVGCFCTIEKIRFYICISIIEWKWTVMWKNATIYALWSCQCKIFNQAIILNKVALTTYGKI